MRYLLWFLLAVLVALAACVSAPSVTCNKPYILVGQECCLDNNNNSICDRDEGLVGGNGSCPELDCSLCPATIVEKNVTVEKKLYVCDKTQEVVEDPADCVGNKGYNAFEHYLPYQNAENRSGITLFTLRPACRDSFPAVEIHFKSTNTVINVTVQAKLSPTEDWKDMGTYEKLSVQEDYLYGAICDDYCTSNVGFFLNPNKVYLLRAEFLFEDGDKPGYSNEYIVDTREDSEYITKLC